MAREVLDKRYVIAGPGDAALQRIATTLAMGGRVLPGFISFRVTTLDTGNASVEDQERTNPDYDFLLESMHGYCQSLAAETTFAVQHGFVNFAVSGENRNLFDQAICLAHLCLTTADGTSPSGTPGTLSGFELKTPRYIQAGRDVTATFTCEAGFGANDKVVDVVMVGTYVHKDLEVTNLAGLSADTVARILAQFKK